MKKNTGFNPPLLPLSRRRFMQGLAAGGLVASWPSVLQAGATNAALVAAQTGSAPVLTGPIINLVVAETWVNFTGQARLATTINGCF
ncbi:MAG TPA: hypothetical protein VFV48_03625, partial [Pseudomonadales bacterium]|nr:hypothetical protein [Pseudomonadales bacterium]